MKKRYLLNQSEAAKILKVKRQTVSRWTKEGTLSFAEKSKAGRYYYKEVDLQEHKNCKEVQENEQLKLLREIKELLISLTTKH